MSATTVARNTNTFATQQLVPGLFNYPVTAGYAVLQGTAVAVVSGNLVPVTATSGGVFAGFARDNVDNTATLTPQPTCGVFNFPAFWTNGTSTDAITIADIGAAAYFMDNQTVSRLNTSGLRTFAGVILGLGASDNPNSSVANMVAVWNPPPGFGQASIAAAIAAGTIRAASQVGTATLAAGTVTVGSVTITASSRVFVSRNVAAGTLGNLSAPTTTYTVGAGTGSFVINSSSNTETSTVFYQIIG